MATFIINSLTIIREKSLCLYVRTLKHENDLAIYQMIWSLSNMLLHKVSSIYDQRLCHRDQVRRLHPEDLQILSSLFDKLLLFIMYIGLKSWLQIIQKLLFPSRSNSFTCVLHNVLGKRDIFVNELDFHNLYTT